MPDIVLSTLNAKYIHAAFGLRYLLANLGDLRPRACLLEFDINQRPLDIAEILLAQNPRIIGLGVYIWNVVETTELVAALKRIRPGVTVILGGPEVSYEVDQQEIVRLADHVITGEADLKFAEACRTLLEPIDPASGIRHPALSLPKIIPAELPTFDRIALPYELYSDDDLRHRVVYVEASRGCPFTCEFCLSSLDIPVRSTPLEPFLAEMQRLLDRGLKQFKFVDRTFNLNLAVSRRILEFFLERMSPGLFVHFEMVPDRLPEQLREIIAKFPPGSLQFEVGIQTFNPEVAKHISRRNNFEKLADNFAFLRGETGVHIHADLIAGLPGETLESFAEGFDRLVALQPQEIQVGILKRLRGTPIIRHDAAFAMRYGSTPPYEILCNRDLDFPTMQRLRRFAKFWDLVGNSGNFVETTPLLWAAGRASRPGESGTGNIERPTLNTERSMEEPPLPGREARPTSPFWSLWDLSDFLYRELGRQHGIALPRLAELVFRFLTEERALDRETVGRTIWRDWQRAGRSERPPFLAPFVSDDEARSVRREALAPKRQARHLA
jgi:radical SAM superfamily enzyme YgiQ (UPF0313 family)